MDATPVSMASSQATAKAGGGKHDARFRSQFRKTELCAYFEKGFCSKGEGCQYAHGSNELRRAPDLTKTSLCKKWLQFSCGKTGGECPFAHGWHELRATEAYTRKPMGRKVHGQHKNGHVPTQAAAEGMELPPQPRVSEGSATAMSSHQQHQGPEIQSPTFSVTMRQEASQTPKQQQLGMSPCVQVLPIVFLTTPAMVHHQQQYTTPKVMSSAPEPTREALADMLRRAMPDQYED